jgi:hypothetical protein
MTTRTRDPGYEAAVANMDTLAASLEQDVS